MTLTVRPVNVVNRQKSFQFQILKSLCIACFVITATLVILRLGSRTSIEPNDSSPIPSGVLRLTAPENQQVEDNISWNKVLIEGQASAYHDLDIDEILENEGPVDEIYLKFVQLDPQIFSQILNSDAFRGLKKLKLQRVKLSPGKSWNFARVNLPQLQEFVIDLDMGFHDQYTDYMKQITKQGLYDLLFYDKSLIAATLEEKLSSDGVEIVIRYDGWTALSLTKSQEKVGAWETIFGLEFADELLRHLNANNIPIVHLTMTESTISVSSIPTTLQYLNLYRVSFTDGGDIASYFKLLKSNSGAQLTELYLELRNLTLKLSELPKTIQTFSFGDVPNSMYTPGDVVSAKTVGLSYPLDMKIIENFDKIFPKVVNVGVFEPTNGTQHLLLKNILKTKATWILMEGFERRAVGAVGISNLEKEVENILENCGVPPTERNFLLFKDRRTFSWYQNELTKEQKLKFRFDILGWDEYITWEAFSTNFS